MNRKASHAAPTGGQANTTLAGVLLLLCSSLAAADDDNRLFVVVKVADNAIAGQPARASVVTPEGTLLDYSEELLERSPNVRSFILDRLAPGVYDVRVEGEGLVTEVKKGVPVLAGRDEQVSVVVRPGAGVHIVEYAVAGLSREEVAVRLQRLEEETARLRERIATLPPRR
ncbi:MAG: hypothetical protein DWQ36_06575 [Acidobacteria bacterium]|nr:MAG: hypothetical protein DWQ30_08480 [Acidobacteriota bacterium]REK09518.1 MAG: hypothetical protein DWQ36_06575 [Acidobacteriota bacterium]